MAKEYTARVLTEGEYADWDQLVETSPMGTAYQTSWWVSALARLTRARMEIIGCFLGDKLCGGCAAYIRQFGPWQRVVFPPTTPYNGFVFGDPDSPYYRRQLLFYLRVSEQIAEVMEKRYGDVRLRHSPEVIDVRGLTWRGWTSWVNYTYVMYTGTPDEVLSRCSSSIRRTVVKTLNAGLHVESSTDLKDFLALYERTFEKQDMSVPLASAHVEELFRVAAEQGAVTHYVARDPDGAVVSGLIQLRTGSRVNTWLLASVPERLRDGVATCTQLHSFSTNVEGVEYVDDASANVENFHHNAVRSGGKLLTVLGTYYCSSSALKLKNAMGSIGRDISRSIGSRRSR